MSNFVAKVVSTTFLVFVCLVGYGFSQEDLLSRVPELQDTARLATGGAKGCGRGTVTLVTSQGEIVVGTGLDPIHVFGRKIVVADLLLLLNARIRANQNGEQNQMSGEVSNLGYVILSTLAMSKDPTVIPVIAGLLNDKDEVIRGWSVIALFRLGESSEELLKTIEIITFPQAAVQSANGRSVQIPKWAKVEDS
jgi:hypothetical protein